MFYFVIQLLFACLFLFLCFIYLGIPSFLKSKLVFSQVLRYHFFSVRHLTITELLMVTEPLPSTCANIFKTFSAVPENIIARDNHYQAPVGTRIGVLLIQHRAQLAQVPWPLTNIGNVVFYVIECAEMLLQICCINVFKAGSKTSKYSCLVKVHLLLRV